MDCLRGVQACRFCAFYLLADAQEVCIIRGLDAGLAGLLQGGNDPGDVVAQCALADMDAFARKPDVDLARGMSIAAQLKDDAALCDDFFEHRLLRGLLGLFGVFTKAFCQVGVNRFGHVLYPFLMMFFVLNIR